MENAVFISYKKSHETFMFLVNIFSGRDQATHLMPSQTMRRPRATEGTM